MSSERKKVIEANKAEAKFLARREQALRKLHLSKGPLASGAARRKKAADKRKAVSA